MIDETTLDEIIRVLAQRIPDLSPSTRPLVAKVVLAAAASVARLSAEELRRLATDDQRLATAIEAAAASVIEPHLPRPVATSRPVEFSRGTGVGEPLDVDEGCRRMRAYATSRPGGE